MRKGSGSYLLRPVSPQSLHMPPKAEAGHRHPPHMLDVRRALEAEAAAICAERATAAEIRTMQSHLESMDPVFFGPVGISAAADWAFHHSIIDTANHPLITQIVDFGHASFPLHRMIFDTIAQREAWSARNQIMNLSRRCGQTCCVGR